VQALGRARHVVLGEQRVERDQQVQVQPPEIAHRNTCHFEHSFPI
jgi:hypothetical protein